MKLHKLSLMDKRTFNRYLALSDHELSAYAFESIYIWKGLYEIKWLLSADNLCVIFQDKIGAFLYLEPLGRQTNPELPREIFMTLDGLNTNENISRIENVEEKNLGFYRGLGFECVPKSADYLCSTRGLAELKGDKYKSKRSSCNYFIKNYNFEYLPFSRQDKDGCLRLYRAWARSRKIANQDALYRGMLEDSLSAIKILLDDYAKLNCLGRVVKVDGNIKGFTFGFKLNARTFCVLYEITDLRFKGLAQFIFREFCREMSDYEYVNIMDDSGLENLKKVKLSYHPVELVPAYIVTRH